MIGNRRLYVVLAWVTASLLSSTVAAQNYPQKPVRIIVPAAAGGAGDIFARTMAQKLTDALGQQVYVENRPGANGVVGMEITAKSPPDGYTLVMGNSSFLTVNPSLYARLPYDSIKDFSPITIGTLYGYVLVVNNAVAARSLKELVSLARARPGQLQYGSSGQGGSNHLAGEMFARTANIDIVHVPFKGSALALADTVAGHVPMMFDTVVTTLPQLNAGRVRALAVTSTSRIPQLPDIPAMADTFPGFDVTSWQSLLAPAGTPRAIIDRLNKESVNALKAPDVIDRLATKGGNQLVGNTPEEFAAIIKREIALFSKVIKDANIRIDE